MNLTPQVENYLYWLLERGQRPLDGACPYCGYRTNGSESLLVCYDSLTRTEIQLCKKTISTSFTKQLVKIFACPAQQGGICTVQRNELEKTSSIVVLGNATAKTLIGECRFARQQGDYFSIPQWKNTRFLLTFHPRDILRHPPNAQLWQRDLQKTGGAGVAYHG